MLCPCESHLAALVDGLEASKTAVIPKLSDPLT